MIKYDVQGFCAYFHFFFGGGSVVIVSKLLDNHSNKMWSIKRIYDNSDTSNTDAWGVWQMLCFLLPFTLIKKRKYGNILQHSNINDNLFPSPSLAPRLQLRNDE